ncbi:MAG TPA: 1-deoxy-D-xylulose-5-phosphate reductoisomerase [Clostridiaceae bacterium]
MKNIAIIGATGSIGTQTLDILKYSKDEYNLIAVSANKNYKKLIQIINTFNPRLAVLTDMDAYLKLKCYLKDNNLETELLYGIEGLCFIASLEELDILVSSVVGMIGLLPTLKAIEKGKTIALANKETLVSAGDLVMSMVKKYNGVLLPVDSEHSAIFQCLQGNFMNGINKILLTASGGPFRGKSYKDLLNVGIEEALNHPKWKMGSKITIDSATMMNKGLEVIEAHHLFNVSYDQIEVIVHPESIIHSMVEYEDGAVIAQLSNPDMKIPIQYALNYPLRKYCRVPKLDITSLNKLTFEKPDFHTFKPLKLAYQAGREGKNAPAILNAANEAAVELFLNKKISFLDIGDTIEAALNKFEISSYTTAEEIINIDEKVKKYVNEKILKE